MSINLTNFGDSHTQRVFARDLINDESVGVNANGLRLITNNSNPMSLSSNLTLDISSTTSTTVDASTTLGISSGTSMIIDAGTSLNLSIGSTYSITSGSGLSIINTGVYDLENSDNIFIETTGTSKEINLIASGATSNILLNSTGTVDLIAGVEINLTSVSLKSLSKTLELNDAITPTDANANGSGLIIKGDTDHSITFADASNSFNLTDSLNLIDNNLYINTSGSGSVYLNQGTPGTDVLGDLRIKVSAGNMVFQHYDGAIWDTLMELSP